MRGADTVIKTSLAPWLTVENIYKALAFYQAAFNAIEAYRLEAPGGGLVIKLSVDDAEFWLSNGDPANSVLQSLGGNTIRMILTVSDPDRVFAQALKAGASEIYPVGEDYGWRLGRIVDPFGLHWEIGHPLS